MSASTLRRRPAAEPVRVLPPSLPVKGIAMTRRWITDQARTIEEIHRTFGDIATVRFAGGRGGILTRAPADIEKIFKANPEDVPSATGGSPIGPFVGEHSLLTLNGRRHLRHRKLLLPPFHGDRMRGYADDIQAIAGAQLGAWHPGTTITLQPHMQAITLEVILRIVFGVEDTARQDELRAAIVKLLAYTETPWIMGPSFIAAIRLGRLVGPVARVAKEVDRLIYAEIDQRRRDPDLASRPDVLSMLLTAVDEDGEPMGEQELRDELVTLLFAGHETTASALSWTFERLVREPEVMAAATEAAVSGDDAYLDAVFQETLRLRPIVPLTARLLQAPMELSGYELESGDLVIISILGACRHPDRYDDPLTFDPTRYLGGAKPDPFAWIPFGGGVRRCIGAAFANLEARVVMREILARTQLEAADPADEGLRRRNVTIVPADGARVNVIRVDR